jgi:hypothetical protein
VDKILPVAEAVVPVSFDIVSQHFFCSDETFGSGGCALFAVDVRVGFLESLPVGLLDVCRGRVAGHPEKLVLVFPRTVRYAFC